MRIIAQEAEVENGTITIPMTFEGINKPEIFAAVYNKAREVISGTDPNILGWALSLASVFIPAFKRSK